MLPILSRQSDIESTPECPCRLCQKTYAAARFSGERARKIMNDAMLEVLSKHMEKEECPKIT